jgi:hypothetical protein
MFQPWLWSDRVETIVILRVIFAVECGTPGAWFIRPHRQAGRELEAPHFLQFCYLLYIACSTLVEFEHVTHCWCPFYVSGNIIPFSFLVAVSIMFTYTLCPPAQTTGPPSPCAWVWNCVARISIEFICGMCKE